MPIERWESEYCGDFFDSLWECEYHEEDCSENPDAQLKKLLAEKCATCSRCSKQGYFSGRYYAPECKLKHPKLPVSECDLYEPSDEIPEMLREHKLNIKVETFKQMLIQ